jgi:hypothetical protein
MDVLSMGTTLQSHRYGTGRRKIPSCAVEVLNYNLALPQGRVPSPDCPADSI